MKGKRKKIILAVSALLALIMTVFGGAKLLVYLLLLVTGLLLGYQYHKIRQLYQDYKLGIKINALQYSQKQTQELKDKLEQYEKDIATANERLKLYAASMQGRGGMPHDYITGNRASGVWQDVAPDGKGISGEFGRASSIREFSDD